LPPEAKKNGLIQGVMNLTVGFFGGR